MQVTLLQQTGDSARVRMHYPFAGQDIDTIVAVERIDGRWYLSDYLRHARRAVEAPRRAPRRRRPLTRSPALGGPAAIPPAVRR